jgi:hypothetical protein
MDYFLDALLADEVRVDAAYQMDYFRDAEPVDAGWKKLVALELAQMAQVSQDVPELPRPCVLVLVE